MKNKKNKGVAGIDVSIAIGIIVIFSSVIASMFYNIDIIKKEITRKSEATYLSITIIEALKQTSYTDIPEGEIKLSETTLEELKKISIPNGYEAKINIQNYKTLKNDDKLEDIIKKLQVTVSYKSNKEDKSVKLETIIVNGG